MIKKIEISEIPGAYCKRHNALQQELDEFMKCDWPACEVDTTHYKSAATCRGAYMQAVRRSHHGIAVLLRGDRVFLVKEAAK